MYNSYEKWKPNWIRGSSIHAKFCLFWIRRRKKKRKEPTDVFRLWKENGNCQFERKISSVRLRLRHHDLCKRFYVGQQKINTIPLTVKMWNDANITNQKRNTDRRTLLRTMVIWTFRLQKQIDEVQSIIRKGFINWKEFC